MPLGAELHNRYLVLRHGESEANAQGIIVSHPAHGIEHFGLTSKGQEDIRRSARIVRINGLTPSIIITSPFRRCRESAQAFAEELGYRGTIFQSSHLSERYFGPLVEGGPKEGYQKVYDADQEDTDASYRYFGAQTVDYIAGQVEELISKLEYQYKGETIVLVTHADVGEIAEAVFDDRRPQTHRQHPKLHNAEVRELTRCSRRVYALSH